MRIDSVRINRRRRCFEAGVAGKVVAFPFGKCDPQPSAGDPVVTVQVDPELGEEGFTFVLKSGREGSVHVDDVLEENRDPSYLRDLLLYKLTLEAQARVVETSLSKREIIRRLGTSATQLYRLLDQTNYTKTVDQMLRLLSVLDCDVQLVVNTKSA